MARDEAYKQAEQKIADALRSGATELDLSGMKLTELPDSLGQLTQLTSLKLSNNQLTALPDSLALAQLTQLTSLDLSYNQLTALPDLLGQLTQLTSLDLSHNQLTALPDSLGQLKQLISLNLRENELRVLPESLGDLLRIEVLYISENLLSTLPEWIENFTQLKILVVGKNKITELPIFLQNLVKLEELFIFNMQLNTLPTWIGKFKSLKTLSIVHNNISMIPQELGNLNNLQELYLGSPDGGNPLHGFPDLHGLKMLETIFAEKCHITYIPETIGELSELKHFDLIDNNLTDLPPSFAQLENLEVLELRDNPLNPALQSAYDQGLDAVKAYLRSLEQNAEPLYEAKLVLVGEGGVGKTTLLNALMKRGDRTPKPDETTTHGVKIDVNALQVPHPEKEGVNIQLNAWDFGGQEVYRVTHQFFFSRRSLYLLVWEPRRGVQQCQVEDWLNMIRLRVGDEARVIIVSTNSKSGGHIARIDQPVFKQQYGDMIVGFHEVDSLVPDEGTGEMIGIAELKKLIAKESTKFNHVGMLFNNDWKAARDELIARPEAHISYKTFTEVCEKHKLSEIDSSTLAVIMHDLGYIVHYSDDEKLRDDVVLKPEWLTKAIGFVLENRATAERDGLLPDDQLSKVWYDHDFPNEPRYQSTLYPFFLRLMEKYDVCYRLTDGKASLVAQHVPQVRPELPWLPEQEPPKDQRRIAMVCALEEDPPGLVPWMIVRTHDYAYPVNAHSLHWQKGMFLKHGQHGEAMLEQRGREFHVYAQAASYPEYFIHILQETLRKLIKDNWPGLEGRYRFTVPCPTRNNGIPCKGRFNIEALDKFRSKGIKEYLCQECFESYSVEKLLFGLEPTPIDIQLKEINERLAGMDSRIAHYFMATMNAIADEGKNGPRLFTLSSGYAESSIEKLLGHSMELQLWCEAEGCQHPLYDYGLYKIEAPKEWVKQIANYAIFAFKLLNIILPIATPAINTFFGPKTTETWGIDDRLKLAGAIIGKLPTKIETPDQRPPQRDMLNEVERSGILALHRFLNEVDPTGEKLGLHRVATYTGDYRWLCKRHYDAYQPNIPDVISGNG